MSFHVPQDDEWSKGYAEATANSIWEYAQSVLANERLLLDLGFSQGCTATDVVIAITVGDRLHPSWGFDYLGTDWKEQDRATLLKKLEERDSTVEQTLREVLDILEKDGYDTAVQHTLSSSPFQVVYLSRCQAESQHCIQELADLGLGTNELSDNLIERHGQYLVIGYFEVLSYYEIDE